MCFRTYVLQKTWLDKFLKKSHFRGPFGKWHCIRAKTLFQAARQDEYHGYWSVEMDCLLTHWLAIISILLLTADIYCKIFRSNYLRKEKHFIAFFFLHFLNLDSIFNILKTKMTLTPQICIFEFADYERRG